MLAVFLHPDGRMMFMLRVGTPLRKPYQQVQERQNGERRNAV